MTTTLKRRRRILAIDNEAATTDWLKTALEESGYEVRSVCIGAPVEELIKTWHPAAVVTDLLLPDVDGLDLIRAFTGVNPAIPVIVLMGQRDIPRSVDAVKAGAFDVLEKPVDPKHLLHTLNNAITQTTLVDANAQLTRRLHSHRRFEHIVGTSEKIRRLFELIDAVASSEANILILGENGTGKELVANAIHESSKRSSGPFIKVNCAAIPQELIESELFGYKEGAFTGATANKPGLFELAAGGSLLLDEIGEMPPYVQTKLLRVLQEREYRPVGGDRALHADFRLICATNVDIDTALRDGKLREDLYFRINTVTMQVPALRDRIDDVPLLCEHFLRTFCGRYQKHLKSLDPSVHRTLAAHQWPGNVRELENAIEHAVVVAKGEDITEADLPDAVRAEPAPPMEFVIPADHTLADIEKAAILLALQRSKWNKMAAARMLGVYRPTLYSKIKKYHLTEASHSATQ